jgi:hypothetical protein
MRTDVNILGQDATSSMAIFCDATKHCPWIMLQRPGVPVTLAEVARVRTHTP